MDSARQAPVVSIITPTFNHEAYIGECIESVLGQSYQNWEQFVVDDGSTDATAEIVRGFADHRVKLITQENRGLLRLAETYNEVMARSTGSLIAILEGDDFWPAHKLEKLVPTFENERVGLAYGVTERTTASGTPSGRHIPGAAVKAYPGALRNSPIGSAAIAMADPVIRTFTFPCSVIIRRDALDKIGGFQQVEGLPFTDYPTFLELALRTEFAFVNEITGYWRQLGGSGTRVRDELDTMRILDQLIDERFAENWDSLAVHLPAPADLEPARAAQRVKGHFDMGRRYALHSDWKRARRSYARAAFGTAGRAPLFRTAALVGLSASLFRRNMEPVARLVVGRNGDFRHLYA